MSYLHLVEVEYVNNFVDKNDKKNIKEFIFYMEQKLVPFDEFSEFLDLFASGLEYEQTAEVELHEARRWYLGNLSLVVNGSFLDPKYNLVFSIEEIFEKYSFIIDYLVQLTELCSCSTKIDSAAKMKKISEIIKDILMFDVYLHAASGSAYDLIQLLNEHFCVEEEEDSFDKI